MTLEGFGSNPTEFNDAPGAPVVRHNGQIPPPPPAITWVAPAPNATVAGATVGLLVSVTSTIAVTGVDFFDASNANTLIGHAVLGPYGWLVTWDSTGVADGARSISATATDGLGQTSTVTIAVTVRNGVAPPTVTWIAPAAGQTVQGSVGFLVAVQSSITVTRVEYFVDTVSVGTATHGTFGWLTVWDSTGVADGVHEVAIHATDANAQVTTVTLGFTVDNIPPAPGPPTVAMLTPATATSVSGATVSLVAAATASSPATITNVTFYVDNVSIGTGTSGSAGYTLQWDSTGTANGSHTIKATVTDSAAQTASVSITVTVNNASQLAITLIAPHGGDTVTGATVGLFATATDNSPNTVTGVQFFANNVLLGSAVTQAGGWLYVWDTTAVTPGTYTLRATATDSTGATASATITVTVRATVAPPVVTIAAPNAGAVVSGSAVGLDAGVTSTVAIAGVQFFHDGVLIGSATQSSFGWVTTWDTTSVADGTHLVTAVATDALSQSGQLSITVTVHNAVAVVGVVMPTNSSTNPAVAIDPTFTRESTVGIRNWVAANMAAIKAADNTVLVPPGIYWTDGPILQNSSVHFKPQDPNNPPVWRRPTVFPYRIKPDLRATINGSPNPAYNPNGRSSQWQYDALGGQAAIPTSLGNPHQTGSALGSGSGGYDATVTRSGTQVIGLTALYGAPWTQDDVHGIIQYLVESGANGTYQSTVRSVALDGKSLVFDNPVAVSSATSPGSEGTVAWCRHQVNAGWKVEHQTNDLLSFYVGAPKNHAYGGYAAAIEQMVQANMRPIVQFTDTSPVILEGIEVRHSNDSWHGSITNFEKSYPVVTEFMRCVESQSANQIIQSCELHHVWGAAEHGPAQILDTPVHDTGMQVCTGHWDNKLIDGDTQNTGHPVVWQNTHHSIIDIENPSKAAVSNVTIQNLIVGGPQALVSYSTPVKGFTIRNVSSTNAQVTAGKINSTTSMWASSGGLGYQGFGQNHLITGCHFDETHDTSQPAMTLGGVDGLTATNNTVPTTNFFLDRLSLSITGVHTAPSPATSGPTLTVGDGTEKPLHASIFGTVFPFYAMIWPGSGGATPAIAEIVKITGVVADTLTIVRAQRGSTARNVQVGDRIAAISVNVTSTGNVGGSGMRGQVSPDVPFA